VGRGSGKHREREGWGKRKRQKMALVRVADRAFKVCVRVQTYDLANGRRILDGGACILLVACSHSPSLPPSLHTSLCLCLSVCLSLSLLCIHLCVHLSLCFCKLIRLQNIICIYSVSGTVDGGSVMAIMGASGSGKTTLLQV
jgi:ABC-type multidrug transport system fused ATPase/permease subunit